MLQQTRTGLSHNDVLGSALLACALAQFLKVLTYRIYESKWDFRQLVASGGMPSSHSALVSATVFLKAACYVQLCVRLLRQLTLPRSPALLQRLGCARVLASLSLLRAVCSPLLCVAASIAGFKF